MQQVPKSLWTWVVVLGLVGQLAWTIENMYLNVFIHDTVTDDPTVLAVTVAASAVAATVATMVAGAWSDRVGRRREFIGWGFVLWGLSTAAFGLVGGELPERWLPVLGITWVAVTAIIALDCIMSIFGAVAYDAAFTAWVTDSTTPGNRGRVDAVVAILPLIAMLVVFGALDPLTRAGDWMTFFSVVGGIVAVVGVVALLFLRESAPRPSGARWSAVARQLTPTAWRANPALYWALTAWFVVGAAQQVYMPFLIIYVQRTLRIEAYAVVLASVLIGASLLALVGGRVLDRVGASRALVPSMACFAVGLLLMPLAKTMATVIPAGIAVIGFAMLATAAVSATVRNHTPTGSAGTVQGLRMIFVVLLPMVTGPFLGAAVIADAGETYVDLGVVKQVPTAGIFPTAAVVALFVVVPAVLLRRAERRAS